MNKFLRVLFILVIIAMTGAIIFQLFFPTYMGSHSGYGISVGWQREIGIWNMAVLVILIAINLKSRLVEQEKTIKDMQWTVQEHELSIQRLAEQ